MKNSYNAIRRPARVVRIGPVAIGGEHPVAVQSMTNTDTHDTAATLAQVRALEEAGCDIVRIAAPTAEAAETFAALKRAGVRVPLVADVHFDYKIALACVKAGADKIRINPGNIGSEERIRAVADACRSAGIPIRVGVNSGSLERHILEKYGAPTAEALAESALYHVGLLERVGFDNIVISIKASTVLTTVAANRILAERCGYPIHLGVTEAGGLRMGRIKSAAGIGALLCDGIGDTLRVSLTADPVQEVAEARAILAALEFDAHGEMKIVACPTCGRTKIDLVDLLERFERAVDEAGLRRKNIKVALMGCAVNGPGEAREADIGVAGGRGEAVLFKHGVIVGKIPEEEIVPRLISEINDM